LPFATFSIYDICRAAADITVFYGDAYDYLLATVYADYAYTLMIDYFFAADDAIDAI
jgi:hypothetical protein